jgi:hypothetical protein
MMIKDLCVSKELDGKAMATLCGGFQDNGQLNVSGSAYAVSGNSGIGSTAVALVAPNQTNVNAPYFMNQPVAIGIAGTALAI